MQQTKQDAEKFARSLEYAQLPQTDEDPEEQEEEMDLEAMAEAIQAMRDALALFTTEVNGVLDRIEARI